VKKLLLAEWVAPMDGPMIRDAGVVFDAERIVAVGPAPQLRAAHPDVQIEDLGQSVILPGLVNAHTHLELCDCVCGLPPAGGFAQWLIRLITRTSLDPETMAATVTRAVGIGIAQCLRFGVTSVGDISRQCHLTRPLLRDGPLRVVSYGEVQAMAQRRHLLEERLATAVDSTHASASLTVGLTPHAPYSVEPAGYDRCLQIARQRGLPLATHLAETVGEEKFLADHGGQLQELWDFLGRFDEHVPRFAGGPIRFAQALGLLDYPTLLAHVNYCDDEELTILAAGRASVVYNPRTHAYFGHHPHRWRDMLASGINVAVGTDSCASSPDLNLVDDLRLMHSLAPDVSTHDLWRLATINGARAIGQSDFVGALSSGKFADMAVFPAKSAEPLRAILEEAIDPRQVWIGGQRHH
jgi:cytosine/adenosine deaminase-related metal-dependent hydrolase